MKKLALAALVAGLVPAVAFPQQTSADQNSRDVPHKEPGTNHPNTSQQRQPAPASPSNGASQQQADVPHEKPDTNNPDMAAQRHQTPKKKTKRPKSTASSTT
jgi:hypothetical protein